MNEYEITESSLPLPDNGRKIQVGDISFVYKNTYHPIYWVGDEPYRPRVETLVIRNGKDVFLRMYDTCEENSLYRYRLPGGSLDNDSTKEQQAENETNEEALLSISEIHNTGLSYYHYYKDGKLLKGGDICIKYKGTISDIFIAKYKGKVDKSTIEKHDLDNDMATNGKFYPIIKVCQLLRPEHIEAIMNSGLVDDNVKGSVRLILRGDKKTKIPEAPVKESTNLSLLGNDIPKNVTLYHASPVQGIKYIEPRQTGMYKDLGPVVFASRYKSFAACFGTYWDDTTMKQGTDPDDLEKASMWIIDKAYDWSKPCSMYILENDGSFKELKGHPHEYISPNKIKVKKEIKFNSFYAMIKAYNIEIYDYATKQKLTVTESIVTEMTTTSSVDDNHTKGESMNLSSFKKIKISKSIIDKMKKMIKSLSHIRLDNTEGYIYTDKNNPVAVIVVETKENGRKWIQALEVFGEYKNHGLSKQLLDVAVNELSATELSVNKKNDVAYSLYKKYGFKTKSETDTMYMMTLESNVTEAKSIGANTTGMKRSELPDEMFGIPSQRKYELDTEKHVRSAIKLFNWVDPKYEKELATNIIKRMKYFNITDVNVGPKNRFGKYYKGGNKK